MFLLPETGVFVIISPYMLAAIWHDYLYQPLFNVLIWIYSNWTDHNLGWAVVYLTALLRLVLLPFTFATEKSRIKDEELEQEVGKLQKELHNDPILRKEQIRKVLKKKKVSYWSKSIVLGAQILVLILLYQVFIRGITGEKVMKILYQWIDYPGKINVMFYGFNLGKTHDIIWPGIVAIFLIVEIFIGYRNRKNGLNKADFWYFILFPAFSFLALWILPMVKSLFILTTMTFSVIIHQFSRLIFRPKKKHVVEHGHR